MQLKKMVSNLQVPLVTLSLLLLWNTRMGQIREYASTNYKFMKSLA